MVLVALLAGLVLGSWSVKVDLRRAEQEVTRLRKELSRRPASRDGRLTGIASMLKLPDDATGRPRKDAAVSVEAEAPAPADHTHSGVTNAVAMNRGSGEEDPFGDHRRHRMKHGDLRKQLETAANAWQVRSDLARTGFISKVTENSDQAAQFDVTMAAMNIRLSNSVRTWVDYVKEKQDVDSEAGIRIMSELSTTLVQAYNDLDRAMPADWRTKAGEGFEVVNFINPEVVLPLTEVEDVFTKAHDAAAPTNVVRAGSP